MIRLRISTFIKHKEEKIKTLETTKTCSSTSWNRMQELVYPFATQTKVPSCQLMIFKMQLEGIERDLPCFLKSKHDSFVGHQLQGRQRGNGYHEGNPYDGNGYGAYESYQGDSNPYSYPSPPPFQGYTLKKPFPHLLLTEIIRSHISMEAIPTTQVDVMVINPMLLRRSVVGKTTIHGILHLMEVLIRKNQVAIHIRNHCQPKGILKKPTHPRISFDACYASNANGVQVHMAIRVIIEVHPHHLKSNQGLQ